MIDILIFMSNNTKYVHLNQYDHMIILGQGCNMEENDLIYKIASFYFKDNLTQQEIAQRLGLSRIRISRLLQKARTTGIVEISLNKPQKNISEEEKSIADRWGLKDVVLSSANSSNRDTLLKALGETAAEYTKRILTGNETVSLSWGSTLSAFIDSLPPLNLPDLKIVQMLGGLGSPEAEVHSSDLVKRFSNKTEGKGRILSSPGVVSSTDVRNELLKDPHILETLKMAADSDIAFVGIGAASPNSVLMSQGRILPIETLNKIKKLGAVGDIALRFFNNFGSTIESPINDRIIGLNISEIKKIPRVIAIAGGKEKLSAIRGALNTGLLDVLITDYKTGLNLLKEK